MGNILALDIGGSKLLCGIVSELGQVVSENTTEFPNGYTLSELKDAIVSAAAPMVKEFAPSSAGATIPGLCNPEKGLWVYAPKSGIRNFDLRGFVLDSFGLHLYAENDVNACAVGEKRFGVCRDVDDFLWITVSTGIGGSIFSKGKLLTGAYGNAGEIGHIKVAPHGRKCGCGRLGCLEAEASGTAIAVKFLDQTGEKLSAKQIALLAKNGNETALSLYREAGYLIGTAIAHAANLLNPQLAVLGGGVSMDLPLLMPGISEALDNGLFSAANPGFSVVQTGLGYNAALLGAAALAL